MNPTQRAILLVGAFVVCAAMVYVPWTWVYVAPDGLALEPRDAGYDWFFAAPETNVYGFAPQIDRTRVGYTLAIVAVATAGGAFLFRDRRAGARE